MKKIFKYYLAFWMVLLALFNVIAFVLAGWTGNTVFSASFWIGYIFITLSFVGQLACAHKTLKEEKLKKLFYNIPIFQTSYAGLIVSFIAGGACMLFSFLPYWIGVLVCAVALAFNIITVIKASAGAEAVGDIGDRVRVQTAFIKSLTIDAETLIKQAGSDEIRAECRKVYNAVRYSDPVSGEALAAEEAQITQKFAALTEAVEKDDLPAVQAVANEVTIILDDRNRKCKLSK